MIGKKICYDIHRNNSTATIVNSFSSIGSQAKVLSTAKSNTSAFHMNPTSKKSGMQLIVKNPAQFSAYNAATMKAKSDQSSDEYHWMEKKEISKPIDKVKAKNQLQVKS